MVQNTEDYVREGIRQLSDISFYREVPTDLTEKHHNEILSILDALRKEGQICKSTFDRLLNHRLKTAELYLLPKIHKGTLPPPGRPIVSANGCPTENISAFLNMLLEPLLSHVKSYLQDTNHFLRKLYELGTIPKDSILATFDVTALYTNIPNLDGIMAIKSLLELHKPEHVKPLTHESILQLLTAVLSKNNFDFNGKHYLQIGGTAMGTRVAPTYANLFMADFEERFVYTYPLQPLLWVRYIDDVFCIWTHGRPSLDTFLNHINSVHSTIKFTADISENQVSFLDTSVIITEDNGNVKTDLFTKKTDTFNFLHYDSCHPRHSTNSIPYSQFLRIRRICTEEDDFKRHCLQRASHFLRRGYPKELLVKAFAKAQDQDRMSLLFKNNSVDKQEKGNHILVTTYNPGFTNFKSLLMENWDILGKSNTTRDIHDTHIMVAYRRPKNLKDHLVHAKLRNPDKLVRPPNSNRCRRPKSCRYCPIIDRSGRITCSFSGRSHTTKHNVCCYSSNIIYCLSCKICGKQYVGQTLRTIQRRLYEHFLTIEQNKVDSSVARHFNSVGHSGTCDVTVHILDFIFAHPESDKAKYLRDTIENNWIQRLHSNAPLGLNVSDQKY